MLLPEMRTLAAPPGLSGRGYSEGNRTVTQTTRPHGEGCRRLEPHEERAAVPPRGREGNHCDGTSSFRQVRKPGSEARGAPEAAPTA